MNMTPGHLSDTTQISRAEAEVISKYEQVDICHKTLNVIHASMKKHWDSFVGLHSYLYGEETTIKEMRERASLDPQLRLHLKSYDSFDRRYKSIISCHTIAVNNLVDALGNWRELVVVVEDVNHVIDPRVIKASREYSHLIGVL